MNIIAGNGYFDKKKEEYSKSSIAITKEMSKSTLHDWRLEQISERDIRVSDTIIDTLGKWNKEYDMQENESDRPTPEQLAFLAEAKAKGWI